MLNRTNFFLNIFVFKSKCFRRKKPVYMIVQHIQNYLTIQRFKTINGLDSIFPADFLIMENEHGKTRGHPYKISKLHSRLDIRKSSFTQRIVNDWNRLPGSAVMSASVNQFKGHIDKYLQNRAEDYTSRRLTPFLVNSSTT